MKTYLRHLIFSIITLALPLAAGAAEANSEVQEMPMAEAASVNDLGGVSLSVNKKIVRIQNAEGLTLEVYNITGVRIAAYGIDSADKQIALNVTKGCYILKVGKITRKVTVS